MQAHPIQRVVIVGGGTAGWMTAALLAKALGPSVTIRLIESDEIGIVGVGEATIPQIRHINQFLGIDEDAMLRAVRGTLKLGIEFNDWRRIGDSYLHAFGDIGLPLGLAPFQHYWLRDRQQRGSEAPDLWSYSINAEACRQMRFGRMERVGSSPLTGVRYAYHLDAGLYGQYLRTMCDPRQVQRTEGKIVDVRLRADDGFIDSLQLESGEIVEGDFFVDCSGFRGLLIEGALKSGYENWQQWLPCDRAVAVASERVAPMRPYTQASARTAGWQWRIPLQHRNGNGHVYCSEYISDDEATATLLEHLDGKPLADPRMLRFTTGMRRKSWNRNCVALGLASGFMEPLESTSIHMIQSGISRLISLFPDRHCDSALSDEYNRLTRLEYESVRDFLVLHYRATEREDTPFWLHCRAIGMPEHLARRVELFRRSGQIFRHGEELFTEVGWLQVLIGQGIEPMRYHPVADALPAGELDGFLGNIRTLIQRAVQTFPGHEAFVAAHCRAEG
jgi:tryptophan halogenase